MHTYPVAIVLSLPLILVTWCVGGRREWALQLATQALLWAGIALHLFFLFRLYWERRHPCLNALPVSWKEPLIAWLLLAPWVIAIVLGWRGTYNPAYVPLDNTLLAEIMALPHSANQPTTINPIRSRLYLAFYGALTLFLASAWLTLRTRRAVRLLLTIILINGTILTVLGIVVNATGSDRMLWFIESHSQSFFGTIYYKNHWGALVVLWTGMSMGLALDAWRRARERLCFPDFTLVCFLLIPPMLLSILLAQARASALAAAGVLSLAVFGAIRQIPGGSSRPWHAGLMILTFLVAIGSLLWIARPQAERLYQRSERQISRFMDGEIDADARLASYRSALSVIEARPLWGWGAGSYPYIYPLYADESLIRRDGKPLFFEFVHNDYLQLLAEHGIVGAILLLLSPVLILIGTRRQSWRQLEIWIAAGMGGVLLMALIDFPFGNPAVTTTFTLLAVAALSHRRLSSMKPGRSTSASKKAASIP